MADYLYMSDQSLIFSAKHPAISTHALTKVYRKSDPTPALDSVSVRIASGRFTALLGASGSGKTTLLNLVAGLDQPSSGSVEVGGVDLATLHRSGMSAWRGKTVGLVFQSYCLFPTLSALENVITPMEFTGLVPKAERVHRARELLRRFGLADHCHKRPDELSGGQQQRVAIARALANDPPLVLADEPTGNLDSVAGSGVLQALREITGDGRTVVVITHDANAAAMADAVIRLKDGRLVHAESNDHV